MSRRNTLTWTAITGTSVLWTATFAAAVTEVGSDRLFVTLRAASLLAAVATIALLILDRISGELHDAVNQAADELHTTVAETGEVLRQDRAAIVAARALIAELVTARQLQQKQKQEA